MTSAQDDIALLKEAAVEAGRIALGYFDPAVSNEVWTKPGDSPVSEADYAVDNFLRDALLSARPDYGWLSEETEDDPIRLGAQRVFVVDPIDGTRGFLAGSDQWCISMAVVENGVPVAGVLQCPAMGRSFSAATGEISRLNDKPLPLLTSGELETVTASRKLNSLIESRYANQLRVHPFVPSLAYRIAMVATGEIDAAFARPGAHDWDLAAADLILSNTGGVLSDITGQPRRYNQPSIRSGSLLACGKSNHERLMELAKSGGFLH